MSRLEIKRDWIAPEITRALSENCYRIAVGEFHKQNLLKLLQGTFGDELAATARAIVDLFWASPIPGEYEALFGTRCALWLEFSTLRFHQVGRAETHVDWHFDYNFFSFDRHALVAWVPFDPVGEDAPGLEFCLPKKPVPGGNYARILKSGAPSFALDEAAQDELFGAGNWARIAPVLAPSDALLFDPFVLHRTQPLANASKNRLAIEFRMTSATTPSHRIKAEPLTYLCYRLDDGTVVGSSAKELFGLN